MDQDLRMQAAWLQIELARLEREREERVKSTLSAIVATLNDFGYQSIKIKSDPEANETGKTRRLKEAANKTAAAIDALTVGFIKEMDDRIAELNTAIARLAAGQADDTIQTLLKQEARALARKVDPLLVASDYILLCQNGRDDLSCRALEEAGHFDRLLNATTIDEGKAHRAARLTPNQTEDRRQLQEMRTTIAAERDSAKRQLREYLPDPLEQLARGQATAV